MGRSPIWLERFRKSSAPFPVGSELPREPAIESKNGEGIFLLLGCQGSTFNCNNKSLRTKKEFSPKGAFSLLWRTRFLTEPSLMPVQIDFEKPPTDPLHKSISVETATIPINVEELLFLLLLEC